MAQTKCLFLTGTFILVLAAGQSNSQTHTDGSSVLSSSSSSATSHNYGFFNGTSSVTLRSSTWNLRSTKEVTFRTCVAQGTFLSQSAASGSTGGARSFQLYLHNGTVVFEWQFDSGSSGGSSPRVNTVSVGENLANSQQYTVKLKYYLGTIYLNVTQFGSEALFSAVVANSSYNSELLNGAIQDTELHIGQEFVGCLYAGPGVNFNGDIVAENVTWNSCPLQGTLGCSIEDQDSDDCITVPCQNGGTCRDLFQTYACDCPRNFNGTNCEIDLARQYGCDVSPCLNNGTCLTLANFPLGSLPYSCSCQQGYTGTNCEVELDECKRNPCGLGICINLVNRYSCNCTGTGFRGENCSEDINECQDNPCGTGTCFNIPGAYSCECPAGLDGPRCQDINECVSSPCQNGGTCQDGNNNYTCLCVAGYEGVNCQTDIDDCVGVTCPGAYSRCQDKLQDYECVCEDGYSGIPPSCTEIDECDPSPCQNSASCKDLINAYRCDCPLGFTGVNCETNIDDCADTPCENNATCVDGINSYSCNCVPGFTSFNCSINIDDCINNYCQNGATCVDLVNKYSCTCATGWTGPTCQVDFDECASNPCLNGATCNDFLGLYNCTCAPGFSGHDCETNNNECLPDPCQNGATCVDGINDYTCRCTPQWMGKTCSERYDACSFLPCQNNATCSTTVPSSYYSCACVVGFTGSNCETNIDNCVGHNCESYQECYDGVNNYTCACPKGYVGANCSTDIDECQSNPCQNNATCLNEIGKYTCQCKAGPANPDNNPTGYTGLNCETDINECDYDPPICKNGGTCTNTQGSYYCSCPQNQNGELTTGYNCEIKTSYCIASGGSPCKNGATCLSITAGYVCHCVPGYTDKNCSTNIDECQSNPCQYNGTCNDGINGYTCDCIPGTTGDNCETNINDCDPNPCGLGVCQDLINDYRCDCFDTGFMGDNCSININDCKPDSCTHNGTCVDAIKNFTCDCLPAYTGWQCETDIPECAPSPCQYNGTCLEYSNRTLYEIGYPGFSEFSYATAAGYKCECIPGTTGDNCEINIDDCVAGVCENGATCVDLINDFRCQCPPGYTGTRCETEINECEEYSPCRNGATCVDLIADYSCQCLEFSRSRDRNYGGKNCSVYLRGCDQGNQCQNGYCVPYLANEMPDTHDYRCQCDPGFTGWFCSKSTTVTFNASGSEMYYKLNENTRGSESFSLRFRTTLTNAIVAMYVFSSDNFVSIEIHNENLEVFYRDTQAHFNQVIDTQGHVSNAEWHQVHVALAQNISVTLVSDACGSERCPVQFSYPRGKPTTYTSDYSGLYLGQIATGLVSKTLTNRTYVGCMEDIIYSNTYLIPGEQTGVYLRMSPGCPRTAQCDPYTCNRHGKCIDLWDSFQCDCDRPYWSTTCDQEYTAATFNKDGNPTAAVFNLTEVNVAFTDLDVSLFLRTRQDSSVIMYLGNENQAPGSLTYVTLELQNGLLGARVHLCADQGFFTNSSSSFIEKGWLNFVQLQIQEGTLMLKVNGTERVRDTIPQSPCALPPTVAYFGIAPVTGEVTGRRRRRQVTTIDLAQLDPYNGVIQDIEIQGYKFDFEKRDGAEEQNTVLMTSGQNLTFGAVSTESVCNTSSPCENGGTCTDVYFNDFECVCPPGYLGKNCSQPDFCRSESCPNGATCQSLQRGFECISTAFFSGDNSMVIYNDHLPYGLPSQQISFKMRTRAYYGAIFETRSNKNFIKVRVWDRAIEVNYLLKESGRSSVLRLTPHLPINDGQWYGVEVSIDDANKMSLRVKNNESIIRERSEDLEDTYTSLAALVTSGTVYIGNVADRKEQAFKGCLEEFRVGGVLLPFVLANNMVNQEAVQYFDATSLGCDAGCPDSNACQENLCRHGGNCASGWSDYCECPSAYSGQYCQDDVKECFQGACLNNGVCQEGIGSFTCVCPYGYTGTRCEVADVPCANSTCANGSNCVLEPNVTRGYRCTCIDSNFTGKDCDVTAQTNCSADLCHNGGTCADQDAPPATCICADGYTGPLCELEINYCTGLSCQQGTCVSNPAIQNYTCQCPAGYTGAQCETDINDCTNSSCGEHGVCEDRLNGFFCNCSEGWTGVSCETDINECDVSVCAHGVCHDTDGSYFCACSGTGYSGQNCDTEINECDLGFCQNGNCNDTEGSFDCHCFSGYRGTNCSEPFCEANICENGGTCSVNSTDWFCICPEYYGGRRCEKAGPCTLQPCNATNTDKCLQDADFNNTSDNYTCTCKSGWEGDNCSIDIDECATNNGDCRNGATCENTDGGYSCLCVSGYTGNLCETNINECQSDPCRNGGRCTDGINSFMCNCTGTGYNGTTCEEDINECEVGPGCENGSCINLNGTFECDCGTIYLGIRCEYVNPCQPKPCKNGGSCNHTLVGDSYDAVCTCVDGYQGDTCEQSPQEDDDGINILYIVGPIVAVILIIIIIAVIAFVMVARNKRATRGAYSPSQQETAGSRVELGNVLKKPPEERLI